MVELLVISALGTGILAAVAVYAYRSSRDHRELEGRLEDALSTSLGPGIGTHLEEPVTLKRLAVVDNGGPVYVPIVHVPLGTTDAPKMDLVFEYVADVLEVVHPILEGEREHVRHYDVQFTFGPDGLLVSGECRRVSVPSEMAARLYEEPTYRAHDLHRDVEAGDDGDDDTAPVLWGSCADYVDSAAVTAATAGAV